MNTDTGEEFEDFLSNSKREELLQKNPQIKQMPSSFGIATMLGSLDSKTDNSWKEVLSKVAESHPNSPLADRYGKRTIKQARTRQVIKKHVDKWKNN